MNRKKEFLKLIEFVHAQHWVRSPFLTYSTPDFAMMIMPKEGKIHNRIFRCYDMNKEWESWMRFKTRYDMKEEGYWIIPDTFAFAECLMRQILKFYEKEDLLIYLPEKISPIIVTTKKSNFEFLVAPRIDEYTYDILDIPERFQELTGCKCPKIVNQKRDR